MLGWGRLAQACCTGGAAQPAVGGCGRRSAHARAARAARDLPCDRAPARAPAASRCAGRAGGVDLSALSIVGGKTCWVVYLDALLLNIGGNLHDALSAAAKARGAGRAGARRRCCRWGCRRQSTELSGRVERSRNVLGFVALSGLAVACRGPPAAGGTGGRADTQGGGGAWGGPHWCGPLPLPRTHLHVSFDACLLLLLLLLPPPQLLPPRSLLSAAHRHPAHAMLTALQTSRTTRWMTTRSRRSASTCRPCRSASPSRRRAGRQSMPCCVPPAQRASPALGAPVPRCAWPAGCRLGPAHLAQHPARAPPALYRAPSITKQIGGHAVVDLTAEEELCSSAALQVAVAPSGALCGITKRRQRGVDPSQALVSGCPHGLERGWTAGAACHSAVSWGLARQLRCFRAGLRRCCLSAARRTPALRSLARRKWWRRRSGRRRGCTRSWMRRWRGSRRSRWRWADACLARTLPAATAGRQQF